MEKISINEVFDKYYSTVEDIETVIFHLKDIGLSQMETTKTLMEKLQISLKESDHFVVNSKAWNNEYKNVISFRENVFDFLKENLKSNQSDTQD